MKEFPVNFYKQLLNIVDEIVLVFDAKYNIQLVNKPIEKLGYEPDSLVGKPLLKMFPAHSRLPVKKKIEEFKHPLVFRTKVANADGVSVVVEVSVNKLKSGERHFFIMTFNTVNNKSFGEKAIDLIKSGILIVDRTGRVFYNNAYVNNLFAKRSIYHINNLPQKVAIGLSNAIENDLSTGEFELNGGRFVGFDLEKYKDNGKTFYLIDLKDITEKKLMERAMKTFDKISSLDSLATGLAHEIKNPLAGMRLMAQRLDKELEKNGDERNREYIKRIIKQIDRIDHLIRTLFSQVKQHTIDFEVFDVSKLIEEIAAFNENEFVKNGIFFRLKVKTEPQVIADQNQMNNVFSNLILNAIDALKQVKGERKIEVVIRDSNLTCPICGTRYTAIDIIDTGKGIKKEHLSKLFYPFFTTKPEGTGLGLFLVQKLIKENKGLINVESELGKGTVFTVYLHSKDAKNKGCFPKL